MWMGCCVWYRSGEKGRKWKGSGKEDNGSGDGEGEEKWNEKMGKRGKKKEGCEGQGKGKMKEMGARGTK